MTMKKWMAIVLVLALAMSLAACGKGEETTVTGMVVSVDGTVITLIEQGVTMNGMDFSQMERPEGGEGFGGFDPGSFGGQMPQWSGQMPEGGQMPQWNGEMPEGGQMPQWNGEMPEGGQMPSFGGFSSDMETKTVDIGNAHISVEIDGGKASGSISDIQPGTTVTITLNGKGEATYVLVSAQVFFRGGRSGTRN